MLWFYLLAKVGLGGFLHLDEHHSRDFFRGEDLVALRCVDLDVRLGVLLNDLEGEVLHVRLNGSVNKLSADHTLGVEHGVLRVGGQLVLGCVTNQTLAVSGEGHVAGSDAVTLVVSDNLNSAILVYANAANK
jgi:NAD-specific glutamate dehydrogenase